jgi:tetratricopeptide (TPR) repeat protein
LAAIILILILISSTWSLFCLLVGAGLFFQHRFKSLARQHPRLFIAICVTAATVMAVFFWNKLAQIYGWGGFRAARGGPTSRLDWWISGLKMWKDHPWFGVGIGNYPSAFPAYQTGTGLKTLYAHGFFVQVLSETGLIGFLALLIFLGRCWSRWRVGLNNSSRPIAIGLCLLLIYSTIQISFEYLSHLLIFGIFLGSIFSSGGPSLTWKPRLSVKIIFVGLGLFALPYLVSPFLASRLWVDGNYLLDENKWEEAEQRFQSSLALDKRAWEPYWGLARIAAARDDFSAAIRWGREALVRNKLDLRLKRTLDGFALSQETNS